MCVVVVVVVACTMHPTTLVGISWTYYMTTRYQGAMNVKDMY